LSDRVTPEQLRAAVSGSSFYVGMRVLPKPEREAMFAIYGFCRIVDDIADDEGGTYGERLARAKTLLHWRNDIDALYAGGDPGQASFLVAAIKQFDLAEADFLAVIDGMQMDLDGDIRWPPYPTLDLYCDRVASAVGRLSVRVFGMDREPGLALAHHLGRALQLTNVLRDIDEDAAIGRVYLPLESLSVAGIVPVSPKILIMEPRLYQAAEWLADKATAHFAEAHAILAARPNGRLIAPKLMDMAYSRILRQLITQGWKLPRKRVRTNKPLLAFNLLKLWLLG
jgi:squalene synthase HpnD